MLTKINVIGKDGKPLLGRYRFDALINGVRHRKQVFAQNKMQAQFMHDKWRDQIIMGDRNHQLFDKFDEYLRYCKSQKSECMFDAEQRHVRLFKKYIPNLSLNEFRRHHAESYIACRKEGRLNGKTALNIATINRDLSTLRFFFGWCIQREYYIRNNPIFKLHKSEKENERVVWLTGEQKHELYDKANAFQRRFLSIALLTGMRQTEIAYLRWDQIDLKNGLIQLFKTKSKRPRTIRIPKALTDYLSQIRESEPFVRTVLHRDGKPMASSTLDTSWRCLQEKLFFKTTNGSEFRFHDLRHAYACDALMLGMSKEELQVQLGHSSVLMVEKYARYIGSIPHEKVDGLIIPVPSSGAKMA